MTPTTTKERTMTTTQIHGAALLDLSFLDDPGFARLVALGAKSRWPNVEFCSHDDLNLLVRGNNWDDVTDLVDIGALVEMDPDELRDLIGENDEPLIAKRAAAVRALDAEGEAVYRLHVAYRDLDDATDDATLDAAWDAWDEAATRLGERIIDAAEIGITSADLADRTNDAVSEPRR
jgi:hypothetical protein